jgi:hypothetical protein
MMKSYIFKYYCSWALKTRSNRTERQLLESIIQIEACRAKTTRETQFRKRRKDNKKTTIISEHTTVWKRDPDSGRTARGKHHPNCVIPQLKGYMATTANEGPARVQYKCLVLIYVLPEMKL